MKSTRLLLAALLLAGGLKLILVLSGSVPFNSDEAIVGLMARHILQGSFPLFFYGQSYMGSLDAFLIAGGFRVFGLEIWVIRLVQSLLYLGFIYTTWLVARRFLKDPLAPGIAALSLVVPTVLVSTYTTATLGGYGEVLVLGNLVLLTGFEVVYGDWGEKPAAWLGLGFAAGLGFWTLGMMGIFLFPVGMAGLIAFRRDRVRFYLLAGGAFLLGSLPWWWENFTNGWSALAVLTGGSSLALVSTSPAERLVGLLLLGVPTLAGIRFPWEPAFAPWPLAVLRLLVFLAVIGFYIEGWRRPRLDWLVPGAGRLLGLMVIGFGLVFIGTNFGIDSTGRYLLPLVVPLALGIGGLMAYLVRARGRWGWALLVLVLAINGAETWRAAASSDRLTTQFDPITSFDNSQDAQLVAFLEAQGEKTGYSNYWVAYRLAFLSEEELIFSPRLPYKANLSYSPNDNRYPAYDRLVSQASRTAYITTKHPELDALLRRSFDSLQVSYAEKQIGAYHIFYDLSRPVRPEELALPDPD